MFSITVDKHDYLMWRRADRKQWPGDRAIPFHLPAMEDLFSDYCRDLLTYQWSASDTPEHLDFLVYYHDAELAFERQLSLDFGKRAGRTPA